MPNSNRLPPVHGPCAVGQSCCSLPNLGRPSAEGTHGLGKHRSITQLIATMADFFLVTVSNTFSGRPRLLASSCRGTWVNQSDNNASEYVPLSRTPAISHSEEPLFSTVC